MSRTHANHCENAKRRDEGKYWWNGLSCSSDCSDCQGEVDEWSYDELNYAKKMEDFKIKNDQEGVCSVRCTYITRNTEQTKLFTAH